MYMYFTCVDLMRDVTSWRRRLRDLVLCLRNLCRGAGDVYMHAYGERRVDKYIHIYIYIDIYIYMYIHVYIYIYI